MFIANNRASFRLWCTENLIKQEKVSKYCENHCRFVLGIRESFSAALIFAYSKIHCKSSFHIFRINVWYHKTQSGDAISIKGPSWYSEVVTSIPGYDHAYLNPLALQCFEKSTLKSAISNGLQWIWSQNYDFQKVHFIFIKTAFVFLRAPYPRGCTAGGLAPYKIRLCYLRLAGLKSLMMIQKKNCCFLCIVLSEISWNFQ